MNGEVRFALDSPLEGTGFDGRKIYADTEIATDCEPSGRVNNTDRVFALREGHVAPAAGSRRDVGRPLRLSADCTGNAARRHCHENRVGSQRRIG
jgi:hypothetical protein